jgi:hypothetical protein
MKTTEAIFEIVPNELALPPEEKQSLITSFSPIMKRGADLLAESQGIQSAKLARVCRLSFRKLRSDSESLRKSLKEHHLRMGKAIDGAHNILVAAVQSEEQRMEEIEKAEERKEEARIEAIRQTRHDQLVGLGVHESIVNSPGLGRMDEAGFATLLADSKAMHEARLERERKEAEEALAKQVAEAQERERIRLENERLLKEAQEREEAARLEREKAAAEKAALEEKARIEAEKAAAEKKTLEDKLAKERADAEAKLAAERVAAEQKAEYERQAAQARQDEIERKAKAERDALEAKHRAEQAKGEAHTKQLREIAERDAAVAKAERDAAEAKARHIREEQERQQREAEAAAERAKLAPDREKLLTLANAIRSTPLPVMSTAKARKALTQFETKIMNLADWIEEKAGEL